MNAWLCSIVVSLALLSGSMGEPVLIYSGTGRQVGNDPFSMVTGPVKRFVLIDPSTNTVAYISYFERQKQKVMVLKPPLPFKRVSIPLPSGKTSFVYTSAVADVVGEGFTHALQALRGNQSGLKVGSDSIVPLAHPRVFSGLDFFSGYAGPTAFSAELRTTVTYNQKRSIEANDADQTIGQVFDAIVAELIAKGFPPPF